MTSKEELLNVYPGAVKLQDNTINWWLGFVSAFIDPAIPEEARKQALLLLAAHNLFKIAESESIQEEIDSIEVLNEAKKSYSKRRYKSTIDNNYDTTPYGIAYKELVALYTNKTVGKENKSFLFLD